MWKQFDNVKIITQSCSFVLQSFIASWSISVAKKY